MRLSLLMFTNPGMWSVQHFSLRSQRSYKKWNCLVLLEFLSPFLLRGPTKVWRKQLETTKSNILLCTNIIFITVFQDRRLYQSIWMNFFDKLFLFLGRLLFKDQPEKIINSKRYVAFICSNEIKMNEIKKKKINNFFDKQYQVFNDNLSGLALLHVIDRWSSFVFISF